MTCFSDLRSHRFPYQIFASPLHYLAPSLNGSIETFEATPARWNVYTGEKRRFFKCFLRKHPSKLDLAGEKKTKNRLVSSTVLPERMWSNYRFQLGQIFNRIMFFSSTP